MTKPLTSNQRLTNAEWLRDQIKLLVKDAESNAKEDASRAKEDSSDERGMHEARSDTAKHYAAELRRILTGLTWEEDFSQRAGAAWHRAKGTVSKRTRKVAK